MRRRSGLDIPETLEDACDPATMALIVYDMQVGVLRQLPDGESKTVERVSQALPRRGPRYPPLDLGQVVLRVHHDDEQ